MATVGPVRLSQAERAARLSKMNSGVVSRSQSGSFQGSGTKDQPSTSTKQLLTGGDLSS